jgi:serine protease Do
MVYSVDGKPLENGRQFDVTLYRKPLGQPVTLDVGRGMQRLAIRVPVVERRDESQQFTGLVTPERNLVPRLGVLGLDLTPELAKMIPGVRASRGVVVAAVAADAIVGLEPGDVIDAVNGAPLGSLADLRTALGGLPAGAPAVLQVGRQGELRFVTVTLE